MVGNGELGDRGQILLISSLLIAVLFVGLAVVVNSAIYTENRATREVTRSSAPIADHPVTKARLGQSVETANFHSDSDGYDERYGLVKQNVSTWTDEMQDQSAQRGAMWGSDLVRSDNGTRVSQDEYGAFVPADTSYLDDLDLLGLGNKHWLIANETLVRGFEMTVNREDLEERSTGLIDAIEDLLNSVLTGSHIFWLQSDAEDGDNEFWRLYPLEDGDNVTIFVVKYDSGGGTVKAECSARANGSDVVDILISEGKIVGSDGPVPCEETKKLVDNEPRDLYYAGADEINGTYDFIVAKEEEQFRSELENRYGSVLSSILGLVFSGIDDDEIYYENPSDGHPYTTPAIWNTTVQLTYQDQRVEYSRNVSVPANS